MNIEIEWLGDEERELPSIGVAKKGRRFIVPRNKGESFIKQKLAKEIKPMPVSKKEGK